MLCYAVLYVTASDPLVDEVELTNVNPAYAHIRYQDGRESTVSLKDLSPCPVPPQQVGTPGPPQVATPAQQVVTPIPNTPVTREDITHIDNAVLELGGFVSQFATHFYRVANQFSKWFAVCESFY